MVGTAREAGRGRACCTHWLGAGRHRGARREIPKLFLEESVDRTGIMSRGAESACRVTGESAWGQRYSLMLPDAGMPWDNSLDNQVGARLLRAFPDSFHWGIKAPRGF